LVLLLFYLVDTNRLVKVKGTLLAIAQSNIPLPITEALLKYHSNRLLD
jgi:hypothetical protein